MELCLASGLVSKVVFPSTRAFCVFVVLWAALAVVYWRTANPQTLGLSNRIERNGLVPWT
ncbi:uncharacterized protein P174DRAFT_444075 [Aspergillus novofumigatus IBT 16806]|uniref:Uncharacterized protein n=1 Tax=Aspergillus novofumigatus (strain IBT 16806) TaxID=1392255 RepID=A0A2I1C391_ASPN1|nr:uncharacterized protein P174DRAFT_444075 [Aspergillus novofumigatus IBT 16806]PKX92051.1 hypothetical protein P174DRAFT_444075 [Aspergillus novofumigatus IBT 16806]